MNSKKNVIIVSARRSGTHLLTDLIVNNFGYESINYNYIDYYKFTDEMPTFESLTQLLRFYLNMICAQ